MKTRGFTLLELLIVLSIIGIAAMLVIPLFSSDDHGSRTSSGTIVEQHQTPMSRCVNGLVVRPNGDTVTVDGAAIRC